MSPQNLGTVHRMSLDQGSSTSASAVFLEVEAFEWVTPQRLELHGRWSGVRGIRLVRPTVLLELADGGQKRLLASLEHKPWTADEGAPWVAAFDWSGPAVEAAGAQLVVGTGLSFAVPAPALPGGKTIPPPSRAEQAEAARRTASRERDTVSRALEALQTEQQDLESRLQVTLAQRDEARQRRDQMRAQLDSALTARQEALAERDTAIDERDDAIVSRDAAIADREETLAARNQAIRARQQAERALDQAEAQRDTATQERDAAIARRDEALAEAKRQRRLAETAELERRVAVQAAQDAADLVVPRLTGEATVRPAAPPMPHPDEALRQRVRDLEEQLDQATTARRKAIAARDSALQKLQVVNEPLEPRNVPTRALRHQPAPSLEHSQRDVLVFRAAAITGLIAVIVGVILALASML